MKKALLGLLLIGFAAAGVYYYQDMKENPISQKEATQEEKRVRDFGPQRSESSNIEVTSPTKQSPPAKIADSSLIRGSARVYEGSLNYRITQNGEVVAEGFTQTQGDASVMSPYSFNVHLKAGHKAGLAQLEVYSTSPEDGSDINMVKFEVTLEEAE